MSLINKSLSNEQSKFNIKLSGGDTASSKNLSFTVISLGYSNKEVNKAVTRAIKFGSTSTLNSEEEVKLANKLVQIHKGMEMVRFGKTGGEACAIAVRIARAFTGRSKIIAIITGIISIAICATYLLLITFLDFRNIFNNYLSNVN